MFKVSPVSVDPRLITTLVIVSPDSTVSKTVTLNRGEVAGSPSVKPTVFPVAVKSRSFTGVTSTVAVTSVISTKPPSSVIVSIVKLRCAFPGSSPVAVKVIPSRRISIAAAP